MCNSELCEEKYEALDRYIDNMDDAMRRGNLIGILHHAQGLFGYLSTDVQLHISRRLGLPAARINGVVTFYSYFTEVPKGRNVINVCMGTACFVRGSQEVLDEFGARLGIRAGETTVDGEYSLDALRCVGACGLAPVVIVNGKVHGKVTKEQVAGILAEIARSEAKV